MADYENSTYAHLLPSDTIEVHEENLALFFQTMYNRQQIWYNKTKKQPWPWSQDEILNNSYFTNVYRELDRSSQYLIRNVYLKETNMKQIMFAILVHRVINKPETFEQLGGYPHYTTFSVNKFVNKLMHLENNGFKVLNDDAYKINTYVWQGEPRWKAYAEEIIGVYHRRLDIMYDIISKSTDIKAFLQTIKIFGVGSFLIHEYYQDFCDVKLYTGQQMFHHNRNSWTNVGPGCSFGLRLIFPSMKKQEDGITLLRDIANEYLPKDFKYLYWDVEKRKYVVKTGKENCNISLHQIEMWLCEFGKYWKMMNKVGKQRRKYNPNV